MKNKLLKKVELETINGTLQITQNFKNIIQNGNKNIIQKILF